MRERTKRVPAHGEISKEFERSKQQDVRLTEVGRRRKQEFVRMRTAIISDIHGNLEALEAVLADISKSKCDRVVCLGDVVGYGANPSECIAILRERNIPTVRGNHDDACASNEFPLGMNLAAQNAVLWTQAQLSSEEKQWLDNLPLTISENESRFVHASPDSPGEWSYVLTLRQAEESFDRFEKRFCFIGHSHQPLAWVETERTVEQDRFDRLHIAPEKRYIINVGSVGQPRDRDSRAAYVIHDLTLGHFDLNRVSYEVEKAQQKILQAGLPQSLADRLERGW